MEWVTVQVRWSHSSGGDAKEEDDDEDEEAYLDGMRRVMDFGASLVADMVAWLLVGNPWSSVWPGLV